MKKNPLDKQAGSFTFNLRPHRLATNVASKQAQLQTQDDTPRGESNKPGKICKFSRPTFSPFHFLVMFSLNSATFGSGFPG